MANNIALTKRVGQTETERLLATLCDNTFLNLWSWPSPFKADRKELCDLLVVFDDHVFVFFDRENRQLDDPEKDKDLLWSRWKRAALDRQIATARGAERYLRSGGPIFIDDVCGQKLPLLVNPDVKIHKIIVAHGAKDACKQASDANVSGGLAISYADDSETGTEAELPFFVRLSRQDPVHVLDSENLELVLRMLDTATDFTRYIEEKEAAIRALHCLSYCGEEDLLGHYFLNFVEANQKYGILPREKPVDGLHIGEGTWRDLCKSQPYQRRLKANEVSYLWDRLLQKTGHNALKGTLTGNGDVFAGKSAIHEMAKEPRFSRRLLARGITHAVESFPLGQGNLRQLTYFPSFFKNVGYVFLQVQANYHPYDEYRQRRMALLEIACGVTRNKFPHLTKVIGISVEPIKYNRTISEDFLLLDTQEWTAEQQQTYAEENKEWRFYETANLQERHSRESDFPVRSGSDRPVKIGRNEQCPCGSGKKYKRCHG